MLLIHTGEERMLGSWPPVRPPWPYTHAWGVPVVSRTVNARLSSPGSAFGRIQAIRCPKACETPPLESQRLITVSAGLRKYSRPPLVPHVAIVPADGE